MSAAKKPKMMKPPMKKPRLIPKNNFQSDMEETPMKGGGRMRFNKNLKGAK